MLFSYFLLSHTHKDHDSTHLSEIHLTNHTVKLYDPDIKLCDSKKKDPSQQELSEQLFFESIISIESFLFLIEINNMTEKDIEIFFKEIIEPNFKTILSKKVIDDFMKEKNVRKDNPINDISTKKEILELLDGFMNFSQKLDVDGSLNLALKKRNTYFEKDASQIAKQLYIEQLRNLKEIISKLDQQNFNKVLTVKHIKNKNIKYQRMIKALRKAVIETENLTKAMIREKREFIQGFKEKEHFEENEKLFETKIAFNLGGSIFAPNIFMQLSKDILTEKKDELIEKVVKALLLPIEKLELFIRYKSNTEKKEEILKFLLSCLEKRNDKFFDLIDEAFKMRSTIINLYAVNNEKIDSKVFIDKIDRHQENYIKEMIKKIKKVKEDSLEKFMVLNRDIISSYRKALWSGNKNSKTELQNLFKNQ